MFKFFMCDCNRIKLEELDVYYNCFFYFDECLCNTDNEISAIKCEKCVYNVFGFARNFFSSINCSCQLISKNIVSPHCKQVAYTLNFSVRKVCVESNCLLKNVKLMKIDEYVEMCLRADPIFFTQKLIILLKFQLMRLIGEIFL